MEKKVKNNRVKFSSKQPQEKLPTLGFHPGNWLGVILLVLFLAWYFGWEYQSSWYWYFGVDINELTLPHYIFFEQGFADIKSHSAYLLFIFGVIYSARLLLLFFNNLLFRKKKIEVNDLFSIQNIFNHSTNFIPIVYFVLFEVIAYEFSIYNKIPRLYDDISPDGAGYQILSFFLGIILLIRFLGDLLVALPAKWLHQLHLRSKSKIFDETPRLILGVLLIISTSLTFISITASKDASLGFRNGNPKALQHVNIESYFPIAELDSFRQGCSCNPYTYGSFGLVANDNGYLYLIPWKSEFSYPSSLYKIEELSTNTIHIVPFQASP